MRTLLLAGVAALAWSGAARADVISTFNASGTFDNGAVLGGTLTIDVTTGQVTDVNLMTTSPIADSYTFINTKQGYNSTADAYVFFAEHASDFSAAYLSLLVPPSSLMDYSGSALNSNAKPSPNNYASAYFDGSTRIFLASGALTPVPEPATLALLAFPMVLGGVFVTRQRRTGA